MTCIDFRLAYLQVNLTNSNGDDQGHAHFNSDYLGGSYRMLLLSSRKSCMGFQLAYLHLNFTNSNSEGQDQAQFD